MVKLEKKRTNKTKIPVAYGSTKKSIILQRTKHLHRNRCAFEELVGDIDVGGHAAEEVQPESGSGRAVCASGEELPGGGVSLRVRGWFLRVLDTLQARRAGDTQHCCQPRGCPDDDQREAEEDGRGGQRQTRQESPRRRAERDIRPRKRVAGDTFFDKIERLDHEGPDAAEEPHQVPSAVSRDRDTGGVLWSGPLLEQALCRLAEGSGDGHRLRTADSRLPRQAVRGAERPEAGDVARGQGIVQDGAVREAP